MIAAIGLDETIWSDCLHIWPLPANNARPLLSLTSRLCSSPRNHLTLHDLVDPSVDDAANDNNPGSPAPGRAGISIMERGVHEIAARMDRATMFRRPGHYPYEIKNGRLHCNRSFPPTLANDRFVPNLAIEIPVKEQQFISRSCMMKTH